jgi:hypothetical protein
VEGERKRLSFHLEAVQKFGVCRKTVDKLIKENGKRVTRRGGRELYWILNRNVQYI